MSHARTNNALAAVRYDGRGIFASGAFKNVWEGQYTEGDRKGEKCVVKGFKTGSVFENHYFEEELEIVKRTQTIIDAFHQANIINRDIVLNTPAIWTIQKTHEKVLVEPMIENFEKFNSNTGWASISGGAWSEAMQALSHFSYHNSDRRFLLCDIQGGAYSDGYILSDPVIMSQSQDCGPADLGPAGITTFFLRHHCNQFCRSHWQKPNLVGTRPSFPMQEGSLMVGRTLPTRLDRNPLSRLRE